jgi:hypothetical protein
LVIHIPHRSYGLVVATGEPQDWERQYRGGPLLPRDAEKQLGQCVGDVLGFLLHAMDISDECAAAMVAEYVRDLAHEMHYIFLGVPLQVYTIGRLVHTGFDVVYSALAVAEKHNLVSLVKEWYRLLGARTREPLILSARDKYRIADAFIATTYPDGLVGVNAIVFDWLAESGIPPDRLQNLQRISALPPAERAVLLTLLGNVASVSQSLGLLDDVADTAKSIFRGILGRADIARVNVSRSVHRILRLLESQLPREKVVVDVPTELTVPIDRSAFDLVVRNLVSNAIEVVADESSGRGPVTVRAWLEKGTLVVEVSNPPPLIPLELRERIFERDFSTKRKGAGLGLFNARRAVLRARGELDYLPRDGLNTFIARLPLVQ